MSEWEVPWTGLSSSSLNRYNTYSTGKMDSPMLMNTILIRFLFTPLFELKKGLNSNGRVPIVPNHIFPYSYYL